MLRIHAIEKQYEGKPLLNGVSFEVLRGQTVCLLGASGSGKSTLLKIIAGLEVQEAGEVYWDEQSLEDVPVHKRQFGLMFQDYALFPHLNVGENVAFGLRMHGLDQAQIHGRVLQALEQVNMTVFITRRVTDLSGGEQQRVALARALAPRPRLLMLDEPLGALDHTLRERLIAELHQVLHATGIPAIYVTHDQEEAFALADQIVLINQGKVEQQGAPRDVYAYPETAWVARFFGMDNVLEGTVLSREPFQVETRIGTFIVHSPAEVLPMVGSRVTLLLKPTLQQCPDEAVENVLTGMVEDVIFRGEWHEVKLRIGNTYPLTWNSNDAPVIGNQVEIRFNRGSILYLRGENVQ
jgi:spermidine/putrescine transport system ATP-binding protein